MNLKLNPSSSLQCWLMPEKAFLHERRMMDVYSSIFGALIGFGMWIFASISYGFRMPFWYLLLIIAVMMFAANYNSIFPSGCI